MTNTNTNPKTFPRFNAVRVLLTLAARPALPLAGVMYLADKLKRK